MILRIALPVIMIGSVGCAHLKVNVDLLDRDRSECFDEDRQSRKAVELVVASYESNETLGQYDTLRSDIKLAAADAYKKLEEGGLLAATDLAPLISQFDRALDARFTEWKNLRLKAIKAAAASHEASNKSQKAALDRSAMNLVSSEAEFRRSLSVAIRADLGDDVLRSTEKNVQLARDQLLKVVAEGVSRLGEPIYSDPLAAAAVYAPKRCWREQINRASGWGAFGNTDIAVKFDQDSTGYSVKGFRLDASKLTVAAFQALQQGLMVYAASIGVPMAADGSASNIELPDELKTAAAVAHDLERHEALRRKAILSILSRISANTEAMVDDAKRAQALETIKNTVRNESKLLSP